MVVTTHVIITITACGSAFQVIATVVGQHVTSWLFSLSSREA